MSNKTYIVAYSSQDRFEIPEKVALALKHAKQTSAGGVDFEDNYYSSHFLWIRPKDQTNLRALSAKQLKLAGEMAVWLSDPIHELDWSEAQAVSYSMNLVRRCALDDIKPIWKQWAMGAYPSAKKFLMEAKQLENAPTEGLDLPALSSGE